MQAFETASRGGFFISMSIRLACSASSCCAASIFAEKNKFIFALKIAQTASFKRAARPKFESENADLFEFFTINFLQVAPLPDSTAV
ncbi:hypothetical protein Q4S45_14575 [Massilia sp. R2A-15]|uniref:hypothetical protein n=1 Tax=Massilia sp. R2A-15 TaxID=3064278 RepID=UPI0027348FAE|nr:hypothetical protein [Massilia sp. R2A-15]WLI87963.1 hypothetical protein Q4S45_14575 [Massilia sp. R2A-15]